MRDFIIRTMTRSRRVSRNASSVASDLRISLSSERLMSSVKALLDIGCPPRYSAWFRQVDWLGAYRIVFDQELQILDRVELVGLEDCRLRCRIPEQIADGCDRS